jgi:phosphate transport system substrate-binding protein
MREVQEYGMSRQFDRVRWRLGWTPVIGALAGALVLAACGPPSTPTATQPGASKPAAPPLASNPPAAPAASNTSSASAPAGAQSGDAVAIRGPFDGEAKTLTGAGATFPAVLYSKWFNEYQKITGVEVNYQSIGSGGGIKSISDQTVDFGATDGPMTDEQLQEAKGGPVLHIPAALGAVVPTYNLPGFNDTLKLTPETLAGIYLGEITKWNDPKLVADNPALAQMNRDIVVVHRSDGSGTTYIFVDYLSTISPAWKQKVGTATSVNWPVGLGGRGNEGVAGEVKQNPYSIGVSLMKNKAGRFIEPTIDTTTAAAAGIGDRIAPDLRASIVDAPGESAYPISGFTWLLAYQNQTDRAKAIALTRMMWWGIHDAQQYNADLGYAPLPQDIVSKGEAKIKTITVAGQPAFPGR